MCRTRSQLRKRGRELRQFRAGAVACLLVVFRSPSALLFPYLLYQTTHQYRNHQTPRLQSLAHFLSVNLHVFRPVLSQTTPVILYGLIRTNMPINLCDFVKTAPPNGASSPSPAVGIP